MYSIFENEGWVSYNAHLSQNMILLMFSPPAGSINISRGQALASGCNSFLLHWRVIQRKIVTFSLSHHSPLDSLLSQPPDFQDIPPPFLAPFLLKNGHAGWAWQLPKKRSGSIVIAQPAQRQLSANHAEMRNHWAGRAWAASPAPSTGGRRGGGGPQSSWDNGKQVFSPSPVQRGNTFLMPKISRQPQKHVIWERPQTTAQNAMLAKQHNWCTVFCNYRKH